MRLTRRTALLAPLAAGSIGSPNFARAQGSGRAPLRVGLSNSVIPQTTGIADRGIEGRRFIGQTIYDPLVYYGSQGHGSPNELQPYLATAWQPDPGNRRVWTFTLRPDVRFHDGSAFDADAVIWNFEKLYRPDARQFKADEAALAQGTMTRLSGWERVDTLRLRVETAAPEPFLPYSIGGIGHASPAQFARLGSWERFAQEPSGTGPFRLTALAPQERAELARFDGYWDRARVPRAPRMTLLPIPDPNTRSAALVSGQVDWIEAVAPDTVGILRQRGAKVVTNPYPQVWSYWFSFAEGSPWRDVRVRRAANLAVDREGLARVLNGMMIPAIGHYPPDHPWFGAPEFRAGYNPREARALLEAAGHSMARPIRAKLLTTSGGSGHMQPNPMNAFIQRNLREVGIEMELIVVDWNALYGARAPGVRAEASRGADLLNISSATHDPWQFIRIFGSAYTSPNGLNWGGARSERADAIAADLLATFDAERQAELLARFHAAVVDDALHLFIAHDPFPRAAGPHVTGYAEGYNGIRVQDPSFISAG
jgi:ABC-type transport system substrate-binding protein